MANHISFLGSIQMKDWSSDFLYIFTLKFCKDSIFMLRCREQSRMCCQMERDTVCSDSEMGQRLLIYAFVRIINWYLPLGLFLFVTSAILIPCLSCHLCQIFSRITLVVRCFYLVSNCKQCPIIRQVTTVTTCYYCVLFA